MHLAALVQSPDHVCCRYRVAAFAPYWQQDGHTVEYVAYPRGPWAWLRTARALRRADVVIVQRKLLSVWQLYLLRSHCRRLVFDFDDAVFLRDSYAPRGLHSGPRLRRFAALVRSCDAVVAGNAFLGNEALTRGARHVKVIPTCVDPALYPLQASRPSADRTELVWIGSSSTLKGLESIRPLLEQLGRDVPGLRLKMVCDRFLELEHLPTVRVPWTEAGEAAALVSADVGVSWIPDDLWSRGKCGLKVLQYMAAGLPVVANPVGVHPEMIRHGETGYLVDGPDTWRDALDRLARDPELRRRMGAAGRRRLEKEYGVAAGAARWGTLLGRLTAEEKRAG